MKFLFAGAASIIETDCITDFDEPLGLKGSKYDYSKGVVAGKPVGEPGSSSTGSLVSSSATAAPPRELQKAKRESDVPVSTFTAFTGSANRIDGKVLPAATSTADAKVVREEIAAKRLVAMGGGVSATAAQPTKTEVVLEPRKSTIGDKYSKKKTAVTAFTGTGHKLG